jgi:hypothetical protein
VRGHLDLALGKAWNSEWWSFLLEGEYRYFRALWLAASTYNKTDEVYDAATQQYFQCLRNLITGSSFSPTDSAGDERSAYWALCKSAYPRTNWLTATAYVVGDQVFYPVDANFYQCHTAHTSSGTLIPTATGGNERWGVLTPFQRYVDFLQPGETKIGSVQAVSDSDPRVNFNWQALAKTTRQDRVYVLENVTRVWLNFRLRRPKLKGTFYSATAVYAADDQIYYTPTGGVGNFYNCLATTTAGQNPTTNPILWELVELPEQFEGYLIWSAYAMLLTADEQYDERKSAEATAEGYLTLLADEEYRQRGETPNIPMRTYP